MKYSKLFWLSMMSISLLITTGCGGSGGSTPPSGNPTVSGVAATGAPVMGTITLKDKDGVQRGPISTNDEGRFSFDVKNLTPPFLLRADWLTDAQPFTLFSVATDPGTVNINPLTHLTLRLAANSEPAVIFGNQGAKPNTSQISNATLTAAQERIKTLLAPLLTKYGIIDFNPRTGTYAATPDNKLDAMLDVISIKMEKNTLSVRNRLSGAIIASGDISVFDTLTLDMKKTPDNAVLADIKEITQTLGTLCSTMNLGTALTIKALEGFFIPDPNYGTSGKQTRTENIWRIVTTFGPNGSNQNGKLKSIRNVRLISELTANYAKRGVSKAYLLNYDFIFENGAVDRGHNVTFGKELSSGQWKFVGDPIGSTMADNSGVIMRTGFILSPLPVPPSETDFSGVWVGSFSSSSGEEYPITLYFEKNEAGAVKGFMASKIFSGEFDPCHAGDLNTICGARSVDGRDRAKLAITQTNEGLAIDHFSIAANSGSEAYSGTGSATRFDSSTESGLRGVWTGYATGPDDQSDQNEVVLVVVNDAADGSARYAGGIFTSIQNAAGDFAMNTEPWSFAIFGNGRWNGRETLQTTGNPVDTLDFSITNGDNRQPGIRYAITLNRVP